MTEPIPPEETSELAVADSERALPVLRRPPDVLFEEPEMGLLRRLWLSLVARRALLFTLLVPLVGLAALEIFSRPLSYQGRAVLEIAAEARSADSEEGEAETGEVELPRELVRTQSEKLESRAVAARAVQRLTTGERQALKLDPGSGLLSRALDATAGLLSRLTSRNESQTDNAAAAVRRIDGGLDVSQIADTRLLSLSFVAREPEMASVVLEAAIDGLQAVEQERWERAREGEEQLIAERLTALRQTAEQSEQALRDFAEEHDLDAAVIGSLGGEQRIAPGLAQAEVDLAARQAEFQAVRRIRPEELPDELATNETRRLAARRAELAAELAMLSERHGPAWPRVRKIKIDLAAADTELTAASQAVIDAVRRRFSAAQARYRSLSNASARRTTDDEIPAELAAELEALRQDATLRRNQYEQLQRDIAAQTVNALLAPTVATVVDPPHAVAYQTWSDRWRWFGIATLLALAVSCFVALLVEWNDSSLRKASKAPRLLRMMPLGDVPKFSRQGRRVLGFEAPAWMSGWKGLPQVVFSDDGGSPAAQEAFRRMRTSVLLARPELPPQTLLVVAPRGGEGSSTVALNLAVGLAETGARTVIVDLNLRTPVMADIFEADNSHGMSAYLAGGGSLAEGISQTAWPDLFILPAGRPAENAAQLMSSNRAETGLKLLREYFSFIVLDSPPVLTYSDVLALAPQVDGTVVVARAGKTPSEDLRELRDLFVRLRIPLLGLVVNGT